MWYTLIAVVAIVIVAYLIIKRVHAATSLFVVGIVLLGISALLGQSGNSSVEIKPTGHAWYDQLIIVEHIFGERFAGMGMAIMVLFGFVAYMRHIGADAKAVVVLSAPLKGLHGSYWMVPVGFVIGTLLSLVIPSASALSLLLIATLLPALVAAGLTPLTVGAVVVTSSTIVPTPLEAGLIRGAELVDMPISEYVYGHVAWATVPTLIITAFVHMWWQRRCDKKDALKGAKVGAGRGVVPAQSDNDQAVTDALKRAQGLPFGYAFLPLLPLIIILVTGILQRVGVIDFEADILPATVISLMVTLAIEMIRHRSILKPLDSMKDFFKGMGEGAGGVVALLVAAGILVEGITQMGVIRTLINATEGWQGAAAAIILLMGLATAVLALITGSGVAPYFAFAELAPGLAEAGVLPIRMLNVVWGTSNLMRQVSPVCAAVLIVAGAIKVTPFDLVKRTAVPMIAATVLNAVFSFVLINA